LLAGEAFHLYNNRITEEVFDPRVVGYAYCRPEALRGGTAAENAARLKKTLAGHSEPLDHTVHLNAAWGLVAAGRAETVMDGLLLAQDAVSSGRATAKLQALIEATGGFVER
jgi:anthranilate phosphoribosyltransferase